VTYSSEQLAEAIAAAGRYGYQPPSWMFSSLRPYTPPKLTGSLSTVEITSEKQPQRLSVPVSRDIVADSIPAEYVPAIPQPPVAAERLGGVTVQLDVALERRRSFWWRLVAKLQFFRS
jgi:hypothetical protein